MKKMTRFLLCGIMSMVLAFGMLPEAALAADVESDAAMPEVIEAAAAGEGFSKDADAETVGSATLSQNAGAGEDLEPSGYVYVEQSECYFTFLIMNDGVWRKTTLTNELTTEKKIDEAIDMTMLNSIVSEAFPNEIFEWRLSINGAYYTTLTDTFKQKVDSSYVDYMFRPGMDYTLTAHTCTMVAENIYVDAIPAVFYDGRTHVPTECVLKDRKSSLNDLNLRVWQYNDGVATDLRYGIDYKVALRNNKDASMKMGDNGSYGLLENDDKKRPVAQITGIGNYSGFSSDVYFSILPYNFGEKHWGMVNGQILAEMSGLKTSYSLKNGKLNGKINPTVTIYNDWSGKTTKLKQGSDYEIRLYRYNEAGQWIYMPDGVDQAGRWLCTLRGRGNYCGTVFGQDPTATDSVFNDGTRPGAINPPVFAYDSGDVPNGQFRVGNESLDISKAKVTVKKSSVPYTRGKYYDGSKDSLGITVKLGNYTLKEGTDYSVTYDGDDFTEVQGKDIARNVYITGTNNSVFKDRIWMSNRYKVIINAISGNPGGYFGALDTKKYVRITGFRVESKNYHVEPLSRKYDGQYTDGTVYYDMAVGMNLVNVDSAMNGYYTDKVIGGEKVRIYDYLKALEADFNAAYGGTFDKNGVISLTEYQKNPGSYHHSVHPFGEGADHSSYATVPYTITAAPISEAFTSGLLSVVNVSEAVYNAGGAIPAEITFRFNGRIQVLKMYYNKQTFTVTDSDGGTKTDITVTVTDNKKPGMGKLSFTGDNVVFKGTRSKYAEFKIKPLKLNDDVTQSVHVLQASDYMILHGKVTNTVKVSASRPIGSLYAVTEAVAWKGGKCKYNTAVYQSYYADEEGFENGCATLAKLKTSQYDIDYYGTSGTGILVTLRTKSPGADTAGFDFVNPMAFDRMYDCYDEAGKIVGITVKYNGTEYELPRDNKTLALNYTGSQVQFDSVLKVKVQTKDGEIEYDPGYFDVSYGDNVVAGKNKGSVTVTLKKGASGFKYGGKKKFTFNIAPTEKIRM